MKTLFRIASTRIEDSEAKMFRALRCHRLLDAPLNRLFVEVARRPRRGFQ